MVDDQKKKKLWSFFKLQWPWRFFGLYENLHVVTKLNNI